MAPVLVLVLVLACAPQLARSERCRALLSVGWGLIADESHYIAEPRVGRADAGYYEPSRVHAEGLVRRGAAQEMLALPPEGDGRGMPTRFTWWYAFLSIARRADDIEAVQDAGDALLTAAHGYADAHPDWSSGDGYLPWASARELYDSAAGLCAEATG